MNGTETEEVASTEVIIQHGIDNGTAELNQFDGEQHVQPDEHDSASIAR